MSKHPMTKKGAEALEAELEQLKRVDRPRIIAAIAEARAHGDLKENAEYHAAKEEQSFNEGRIQEVESKLNHAQIIDVTQHTNQGKVIFGSTVHLTNLDTEEKSVYTIVGDDEADLKSAKISYLSPIARAVIGKTQGDEIEVKTPKGLSYFEITEVLYI